MILLRDYNNIRNYYGCEKLRKKIYDTKRYLENWARYESGKFSYYHKEDLSLFDIDIEKVKNLISIGQYDDNRENLYKEFLKKTTYVDENVFSFYDYFRRDMIKNLSEDIRFKLIKYHLKEKKRKTYFSDMLGANLLTEKIIKDLKFTDIQLKDLLFPEFKNLLRKKINIEDITKLKKFKKIRGIFSDTLIVTIATQFVKEAEKKTISATGIEVVLSMFFHYLGISIEDYPEVELLLTLSLDREIDI